MFLETYLLIFILHYLNLCRMLESCKMNQVALESDWWRVTPNLFIPNSVCSDITFFNNDRDVFIGEPWFLHLLHFVSYQLKSCRPLSVLHSWVREAAHRLVLETTRAALPAVLVFLITMTLMQVCAFISHLISVLLKCVRPGVRGCWWMCFKKGLSEKRPIQ